MKLSILALWLFVFPLFAQESHLDHTVEPLQVLFDDQGIPSVSYTVNKENSIFQASKKFHTPVDKILAYNNIIDSKFIESNKTIRIPLDLKYVYTGSGLDPFQQTKFIPLQYIVKKKENLYRIAKVYCKESIEDMKFRNGLTDNNLQIGQKLIIGWIPILEQIKVSKTKEVLPKENILDPVGKMSSSQVAAETKNNNWMDSTSITMFEVENPDSIGNDSTSIPLKVERGIAIWKKSSIGHSKYALHPTAKINSEIELYNPIVNRTVKAKVIGRIPVGAYSKDVSIIISPATAVSLGALDHRFSVRMTYEEEL